jgi:hypothetical protein
MKLINPDTEQVSAAACSVLFEGCDLDTVMSLLKLHSRAVRLESGEALPDSMENGGRRFAVLTDGSAVVYADRSDRTSLMRYVRKSDTVGVASFYTSSEFSSEVVSFPGRSVFLMIGTGFTEAISETSSFSRFSLNYLSYLSDRIAFLMSRISCVTSGSADSKLAFFLRNSAGKDRVVRIDMPMSSLASLLNIGRASLYRSLDHLTDAGVILRDGNMIFVKDQQKLDTV